MTSHRVHRPRLAAVLAALALFVAGSNLCLVTAFASPRPETAKMGCCSGGTTERTPAPTSPCGSHGGSTEGGAAMVHPPCCIAALQVAAPSVEKAEALVADLALDVEAALSAALVTGPATSLRSAEEPFPEPLHARAPSSLRAPPSR